MHSQRKPSGVIPLLAALVAFVPLSIDTCLPSLPAIAADLHSPGASVQLTIGVFLAGLCIGMLFYGPMSDHAGRRPFLLGGIVVYIVASLGCMLAQSVEQLLLWRFVQALGGAGAMVIARAVVRDLFALDQAARVLSLMHLITMVSTLLAPMAGTWLVLIQGWRTIFAALLVLACACLLASWWTLPESLVPQRRSASLLSAFKGYATVLREPDAVALIACMACSFGGMFAFISASPFVFIHHFGFSPRSFAWVFALNIVGIIVVSSVNARWVGRFGSLRMLRIGAWTAALAGLLLLGAGLGGGASAVVIILCVIAYMGITGLIGANCTASLMAMFPANAGAAISLAVSLQFAGGSLFSWLVSRCADGTPLPMCIAVGLGGLGCLAGYLCVERQPVAQTVG